MDDMLKYENITKEDWSNPNISEEKKNLMIDYIRYADKNAIELTMEQIDFKFTLLSPDAVKEMSKNYGTPVDYNNMHSKWIITVAVSGDEGYNIFKAADELTNIWWTKSKGNKNIDVGDIVYMYVGRPYSKIMYKFKCTNLDYEGSAEYLDQDIQYWNKPELHLNERGESFCITKMQYLDDENLSLKTLNEKGIIKGNIRSTFKSDNNPELFRYVDEQFNHALKDVYYDEEDLKYDSITNDEGEILHIEDTPQNLRDLELLDSSRTNKRDARVGRYAIKCAEYKCEVDETHRTFISRGSDKPYLEAHHLIPISAQEEFEYSLDVPANIVALCSVCHNEIHYGKEAELLIRKLYTDRYERLRKSGIDISIGKLLKLYNL